MYIYRNPILQSLNNAQQTLQALQQERARLVNSLAELSQQISECEAYIGHAQKVIANDPNRLLATVGLTPLCKAALERAGGWVTAHQVRQLLMEMGIDLTGGYTNPMAVLHATLKRISEMYHDGQNALYVKKGTLIPWGPLGSLNQKPR